MKGLREIYKRVAGDVHFTEMLSKATRVLFIRIAGAGAGFLLTLYLARRLGTDDYGYFSLALTIVLICGVIARAGLDNVSVKNIAAAREQGDIDSVRGNFRVTAGIVTVTSLLLFALVYLPAPFLANTVFEKPELVTPLRGMAWMLVPHTIMFVAAESLRGLRLVAHSALAQQMLIPFTALVAALLLSLFMEIDLQNFVVIYVLSSLVAMLFVAVTWYRGVEKGPSNYPSPRVLLRNGMPLLLASAGGMALAWTDTIVLGAFRSAQEVGIYAATSRTAMLLGLIIVAVNSISGPKFSAFFSQNNHDAIKRLSRQATLLMMMVVIIPAAIMMVWPEYVLLLFGEQFQGGSHALAVLVLAQVINISSGSSGLLLVMTNHEKIVRNVTLTVAMMNALVSVALVNDFGMVGVASATALAHLVQNAWLTIMVRNKLGFWTVPVAAVWRSIRKHI